MLKDGRGSILRHARAVGIDGRAHGDAAVDVFPGAGSLDDVQAAAIANPGMSAWGSMKQRGKLVAGETVLVMGATGVAGQLALQVARHLGAKRVIGAGRNVESWPGQTWTRSSR